MRKFAYGSANVCCRRNPSFAGQASSCEEVLNAWPFNAVREVQQDANDWLGDYNEFRLHESLGTVPPVIFKARAFNQEVFTPGFSP